MSTPAPLGAPIRFGPFDLDPRAGELHKRGVRLKLQGQPFQVLCLLLERPGDVVTREELRTRLWPADTFVDFDIGLNTAIKKVRDALGDSADTPRFIETLPRRGYRFIYPVSPAPVAVRQTRAGGRRARLALALTASLLVVGLVLSIPAIRNRFQARRMPGKTLRVAVLPLKNLSGDPQQEYFAAGMTEMLITELGRLGPLQVTSHQSVLGYAQSSEPLPQIARELGVDAVLEGTVQRSGDRVRVTVNLVQAQPENHLLAESYEESSRDVFAMQEEVARAIAGAIRVQLPGAQRPGGGRPVAPEATDAYLRGAYLLAKGRDSDRDEARFDFQKAIELDPSFARPYAALAVMYAHGGAIRGAGGGDTRKLTREWAEKALELDDSLVEAHTALAWIAIYDWDFKRADSEFRRAIELNPSYALAHAWYAQFLGVMERYPEAFAQTEAALRLAPGAPDIEAHAIEPYLTGGRVDEAISHLRTILEAHPDYWGAHFFLALAYMRKGTYREALAEAEETVQTGGRSPEDLSLLGSAYALAGERRQALAVARELESTRTGRGGVRVAGLARIYAALGENEKALDMLETAYRRRGPGLAFVNAWPQFDGLRQDPRFVALLHGIGLPAAPKVDPTTPRQQASR